MGFIYKVTNNQDGKIYIGQTSGTVEKRLLEHFQESTTNNKNRPFHKAIREYGKENFSVDIIEQVDDSLLNDREKYWIQYFHSYMGDDNSNGYNATRGGDGSLTYDYRIIVKDYLQTHSKEQTAKNIGCCLETVRRACNEYKIKNFNNSVGVAIVRIHPETQEKKCYKSIKEASEELCSILENNAQTVRKRISYVLIHRKDQKAYGYYWKELKQ